MGLYFDGWMSSKTTESSAFKETSHKNVLSIVHCLCCSYFENCSKELRNFGVMNNRGRKPLENNYEPDRISDASSGQTNAVCAPLNLTPFPDIHIFSLYLNLAVLHIGLRLVRLFFVLALLAKGRHFVVTYWAFNGAESFFHSAMAAGVFIIAFQSKSNSCDVMFSKR
jgi:hypothetical protein